MIVKNYFSGVPGRTRTCSLQLRRLFALLQLSYKDSRKIVIYLSYFRSLHLFRPTNMVFLGISSLQRRLCLCDRTLGRLLIAHSRLQSSGIACANGVSPMSGRSMSGKLPRPSPRIYALFRIDRCIHLPMQGHSSRASRSLTWNS